MRKERQRYILFSIIKSSDLSFTQKDLTMTLWKSIWRYFGMKEANKIGLWVLELNNEKNYGIIRCSHQTKEILITSLTLITEINHKKVIISPIKTSGTIKKIREISNLFFYD